MPSPGFEPVTKPYADHAFLRPRIRGSHGVSLSMSKPSCGGEHKPLFMNHIHHLALMWLRGSAQAPNGGVYLRTCLMRSETLSLGSRSETVRSCLVLYAFRAQAEMGNRSFDQIGDDAARV